MLEIYVPEPFSLGPKKAAAEISVSRYLFLVFTVGNR